MRFLKAGLTSAALVVAFAACDGTGDICVTNADCSAGEYCDPTSAKCRCGDADPANDPGGTSRAAACNAANAENVCDLTTDRCVKGCFGPADCPSGKTCNTTTNLCVDDNATDCTLEGCTDSNKVCDPVSTQCIDKCTASSCGNAKVCNEQSFLCEDDCTASGVTCPSGERCNTTTKLCEQGCGSGTCDVTEVCDTASLQCIPRCDAATNPTTCGSTERCDTTTGACVAKCTSSNDCQSTEACDGSGECVPRCTGQGPKASGGCDTEFGEGFCDLTTGLCEDVKDITECNPENQPASPREYVDPTTNQCTATSALETCTKASSRDGGTAETNGGAGPTLYNAVQIARTASDTRCTGGPSVKVLVEYYDPTGGMLNGSGNVPYANVYQSVSGGDSNTLDQLGTCKGTTAGCQGLSSDQKRGAFTFELCRPTNAPASEMLAVYASDTAGNFGNTICFESTNQ